jgi:hypothetical protein
LPENGKKTVVSPQWRKGYEATGLNINPKKLTALLPKDGQHWNESLAGALDPYKLSI